VPPTIAHDTKLRLKPDAIIKEIGRENVMIKIPARGGLPAVEQVISEGINVNVTLLFSVESYTVGAYIRGLEKLAESGNDINRISSVANFFP